MGRTSSRSATRERNLLTKTDDVYSIYDDKKVKNKKLCRDDFVLKKRKKKKKSDKVVRWNDHVEYLDQHRIQRNHDKFNDIEEVRVNDVEEVKVNEFKVNKFEEVNEVNKVEEAQESDNNTLVISNNDVKKLFSERDLKLIDETSDNQIDDKEDELEDKLFPLESTMANDVNLNEVNDDLYESTKFNDVKEICFDDEVKVFESEVNDNEVREVNEELWNEDKWLNWFKDELNKGDEQVKAKTVRTEAKESETETKVGYEPTNDTDNVFFDKFDDFNLIGDDIFFDKRVNESFCNNDHVVEEKNYVVSIKRGFTNLKVIGSVEERPP